ncbi:hypothetical protein NUW54_g6051 [Trametes sanguinea]|uniref:Uncharacterized protein n=1 Tax=Trametes sanguinea TaxID=158606 RepID=A0ACC1PTW5_9APHY|nr:hypothetical protein NUW54_g6051 [Trametes sanguinea]
MRLSCLYEIRATDIKHGTDMGEQQRSPRPSAAFGKTVTNYLADLAAAKVVFFIVPIWPNLDARLEAWRITVFERAYLALMLHPELQPRKPSEY